MAPVNIPDTGDTFDVEKWDFYEGNLPIYYIDKYPYKASSMENARKLYVIRKKIDKLCQNLINDKSKWQKSTSNREYLDGVNVFLGLHCENYYDPNVLPSPFFEIAKKGQKTSRYLISEIPRGTQFAGLSKPKMRYIDIKAPSIGKDTNIRALYRDIFLDLSMNDKELKELIIHELAHSMANHVRWWDDNHGIDFKWAEKLIAEHWY
jgi:hypothetical protein